MYAIRSYYAFIIDLGISSYSSSIAWASIFESSEREYSEIIESSGSEFLRYSGEYTETNPKTNRALITSKLFFEYNLEVWFTTILSITFGFTESIICLENSFTRWFENSVFM